MKNLIALVVALVWIGSTAYAQVRIGLVFDAGGKFDKSFNQSAWEGVSRAKENFGIDLKDAEPSDTSAVEEALRAFAAKNYDLVMGVGFANAGPLGKVAKEFPNVNFAIIDSVVELPNVASLVFREHEGSFLVGMLAAIRSRNVEGKRTLGFIGGMDIPLIRKFEAGYQQGAKLIYPQIRFVSNFIGNTGKAWNDPAKGKEIAKAQITKGASVIYAAAGASGNGLFDAIKEANGKGACLPKFTNRKRTDSCVYAVGVDANQNYIIPGQILTSMLKRVDIAVYQTIRRVKEGDFQAGINVFGLKNNGVGYSLDEHNRALVTKKMITVVNQYRDKIIRGEITVNEK